MVDLRSRHRAARSIQGAGPWAAALPAAAAWTCCLVGVAAAHAGRVLRTAAFQYVVATAAAFLIFFARAPAAYVSPMFFTEDGPWSGMVLTRGAWETARHARGDYCVLGNVLLIRCGIAACRWTCGGDLFALPACLAVVSYLFFAAVASLPVLLLRRQLTPAFRWTAWLMACVMPMGIHSEPPWSGFEVLGRVSNVGFACLYAAFVLLWHRVTRVRTARAALPVDVGLFLCAATNPCCMAMLPAAAWPWLRRRPWPPLRRPGALVSLGLLAGCCLAFNGLPGSRAPYLATTSPAVGFHAAVEMGVARALLFPIAWPVYSRLSTPATLGAAAVAACRAAGRAARPRGRRRLPRAGLAAAAVAVHRLRRRPAGGHGPVGGGGPTVRRSPRPPQPSRSLREGRSTAVRQLAARAAPGRRGAIAGPSRIRVRHHPVAITRPSARQPWSCCRPWRAGRP